MTEEEQAKNILIDKFCGNCRFYSPKRSYCINSLSGVPVDYYFLCDDFDLPGGTMVLSQKEIEDILDAIKTGDVEDLENG